jgi:hypothetical protein
VVVAAIDAGFAVHHERHDDCTRVPGVMFDDTELFNDTWGWEDSE